MKIYTRLFIIVFLFILTINKSDAQTCLWAYTEGYAPYTVISALKKDHAGDFYLGTYVDSNGHYLSSRIEKRDAAQNILWHLDLAGGTEITDIEINNFNHAVFTGYYTDTLVIGIDSLFSVGYYSTFLIETDVQGNLYWVRNFNPHSNEFKPVDLFIDKADNLYLTAQIAGTHGSCSFHKLDTWGFPMHDEFNNNFEVRTFSHILADNHGNVYLSGTCGNFATFDSLTVNTNFSYQNMLVKYDSAFNAQWVISREYITFDHNNGLSSDGNYLYWSFDEFVSGADTIKLVKTDYNGQIIADVPGPLGSSFFPSLTFETDSSGKGFLVANVYNRLFLYHFDNNFNLLWEDTILSNTSGFPSQLKIECEDSAFYLAARYVGDSLYVDSILLINPNATTGNHSDILFAKWGSNNTVSVPSFSQNDFIKFYPNPANDQVKIIFEENITAVLNVYDYSGKIVLSENISGKGKHDLNVSGLINGIYFLQITDDKSTEISNNRLLIQR